MEGKLGIRDRTRCRKLSHLDRLMRRGTQRIYYNLTAGQLDTAAGYSGDSRASISRGLHPLCGPVEGVS